MAKELPFFKFYVSEWLTGDITMLSMESQGVFANICSFYWLKKGDITYDKLCLRFKNNTNNIDDLIDSDIIKLQSDGFISIEFLDEQFEVMQDISNTRSLSGAKGGLNSKWKDTDRKKGEQLYILLVYNDKELFVKIGVTKVSIARRYSTRIPYELTTLLQVFSKQALKHEQSLGQALSKHIYEPKHKYPGHLESYNIECLDFIYQYISDLQPDINNNYKPIIEALNSDLKAKHKQSISKLQLYKEVEVEVEADTEVENSLGTNVPDDNSGESPPLFSLSLDEQQEEEKPKNKKTPQITTLTHKMRLVFEEYYKEQKSDSYYYQAVDGKQLTNIKSKIIFVIKERNGKDAKPTDDEILEAWKYLLDQLEYKHTWVFDNLSISNINTKFNEIIANIRKGRKQQQHGKKEGTTVEQLAGVVSKHFTKD